MPQSVFAQGKDSIQLRETFRAFVLFLGHLWLSVFCLNCYFYKINPPQATSILGTLVHFSPPQAD
jgi:hypothetical protein